jgi:hypothetical protein
MELEPESNEPHVDRVEGLGDRLLEEADELLVQELSVELTYAQ